MSERQQQPPRKKQRIGDFAQPAGTPVTTTTTTTTATTSTYRGFARLSSVQLLCIFTFVPAEAIQGVCRTWSDATSCLLPLLRAVMGLASPFPMSRWRWWHESWKRPATLSREAALVVSCLDPQSFVARAVLPLDETDMPMQLPAGLLQLTRWIWVFTQFAKAAEETEVGLRRHYALGNLLYTSMERAGDVDLARALFMARFHMERASLFASFGYHHSRAPLRNDDRARLVWQWFVRELMPAEVALYGDQQWRSIMAHRLRIMADEAAQSQNLSTLRLLSAYCVRNPLNSNEVAQLSSMDLLIALARMHWHQTDEKAGVVAFVQSGLAMLCEERPVREVLDDAAPDSPSWLASLLQAGQTAVSLIPAFEVADRQLITVLGPTPRDTPRLLLPHARRDSSGCGMRWLLQHRPPTQDEVYVSLESCLRNDGTPEFNAPMSLLLERITQPKHFDGLLLAITTPDRPGSPSVAAVLRRMRECNITLAHDGGRTFASPENNTLAIVRAARRDNAVAVRELLAFPGAVWSNAARNITARRVMDQLAYTSWREDTHARNVLACALSPPMQVEPQTLLRLAVIMTSGSRQETHAYINTRGDLLQQFLTAFGSETVWRGVLLPEPLRTSSRATLVGNLTKIARTVLSHSLFVSAV